MSPAPTGRVAHKANVEAAHRLGPTYPAIMCMQAQGMCEDKRCTHAVVRQNGLPASQQGCTPPAHLLLLFIISPPLLVGATWVGLHATQHIAVDAFTTCTSMSS